MSELPELPEPPSMSMLASRADLRYTAEDMREYAGQAVAAYKDDAERYRWLRDYSQWAMRDYPMLQWHLPRSFRDERTAAERLDASIDAARKPPQ